MHTRNEHNVVEDKFDEVFKATMELTGDVFFHAGEDTVWKELSAKMAQPDAPLWAVLTH